METEDMDLDTLARMVAEGFLGIDKRFEKIDERFEILEHKMVKGFKEVNLRIDTVVEMLDGHSRRIKDLELAK
ncbi:MAG: hypothetical protein JWL75_396 [Parcubacteria group bacterium]|nr:hypothetical protein [Parcubacteria group bacterium]